MKEKKIDIILNSAEELMCSMEEPNKDMTVDMIAKNAGIGKGSIYYYFESKDEIIDAVIERSYSSAIKEYFTSTESCKTTYEKLRQLFVSIIKKEFLDNSHNVIISLHIQDDIILHYKMMMTAIKTVSPILTQILEDGVKDGSVHTEAPQESAEMIVAMLTFLLNRSFFPSDDASIFRKLRMYANVLETCLETEKGTFDFLFTRPE
ncbi:MAG: TetR/AcrR family transcriptional regulator [Ruminococcus sp.]|nr:TetR/AcrR family transcriptional regulator [Ruminococcus sp.]MDE7138130.1 TetR/AcrR family transcriptional regulator [Ruminococcus sp.]